MIINKLHLKGRFLLSTFFILFYSCQPNHSIEINGNTMGTTYSIIIHNSLSVYQGSTKLNKEIDSILLDINNVFSTYIDSSEINRINRSEEDTIFISKDFSRVLEKSIEVYQSTNGYFDPTLLSLIKLWDFHFSKLDFSPPSRNKVNNYLKKIGLNKIKYNDKYIIKSQGLALDFNAIAKGYAVDILGEYLFSKGYEDFMIEIGGEVLCRGDNKNKKWKIGLQNPFEGNEVFDILKLTNMAVATSGTYRNYHMYNNIKYSHIINPLLGHPVSHNTVSVSVIHRNCLIADAYATGLIAMETEKAIALVNSIDGLEAIFVSGNKENYNIYHSKGYDNLKK